MVKYLFNEKVQIFTHKNFVLECITNFSEGDPDFYDNALTLGYITICW